MGTLVFSPQSPDESLKHRNDLSLQLAGATIAGSSWVDFPNGKLNLDSSGYDDRYAWAYITVLTGSPGENLTFTNRVVTSGGEIIDTRCMLPIHIGTLNLEPQDPDEVFDHVLDWDKALGDAIILDSSWEDIPDPELNLLEVQFDDRFAQARISVGTAAPGASYTFKNVVTTSDGEVVSSRCMLPIRNG